MTASKVSRGIAFVLTFLVLSSMAGDALSLGLKFGFNSSHVGRGEYTYKKSDSVVGLIGGVYHDFSISEIVTFRPSLLIARRGGVYHDLPDMLWGGQATVDELRFRRDYLELPLVFRFSPLGSRAVSPFLTAGLMWGLVLSSEVSEDEELYPNHAGKSDSALVLGFGCVLNGLGREVEMEFMYRLTEDGPFTGDGTGNFRSRGFAVMVGVGL